MSWYATPRKGPRLPLEGGRGGGVDDLPVARLELGGGGSRRRVASLEGGDRRLHRRALSVRAAQAFLRAFDGGEHRGFDGGERVGGGGGGGGGGVGTTAYPRVPKSARGGRRAARDASRRAAPDVDAGATRPAFDANTADISTDARGGVRVGPEADPSRADSLVWREDSPFV